MKNIPTDFYETADPCGNHFNQVVHLTRSPEVHYSYNEQILAVIEQL